MTSMTSFSTFSKTSFYEPDPNKPKLVLAYSGGLDTSCQLNYLVKEKGFEVCAYIADLGQEDVRNPQDVEKIKQKAEKSGAYAFYCEDLKRTFIEDYVFPMISSNALYEGRYLLGTSIARPCIANRQVEICAEEKASHVSHGSTGKGNDQVRFELAYHCLDPRLETITLWRDPSYCQRFQGRRDLQNYAIEQGIVGANSVDDDKPKVWAYSEDENCLHISFESGELEDTAYPGKQFARLPDAEKPSLVEYPGLVLQKTITALKDTPDVSDVLKIEFEQGYPVRVENLRTNEIKTDAVDLFFYLHDTASRHGVGGIDIVENRFVGMKSRGCYETPAGSVLFSAHHDLELLTMDREVMRIRDSLTQKYSELVYNGYWFSPEMSFLKSIMKESQQVVSGTAYVELYKGSIRSIGRESSNSLYDEKLVSMDEHGEYDPSNATGFIKTLATRLKAVRKRDEKLGRKW